jgi:hypothetical protein
MQPRAIRQSKAPEYLGMSESQFNKMVRPFLIEIKDGRMVSYDRLDLDAWFDQYKAANGKPAKESKTWQRKHQGSASAGKSGTSTKLSPVSSYAKAREKLNSNRQSDT